LQPVAQLLKSDGSEYGHKNLVDIKKKRAFQPSL